MGIPESQRFDAIGLQKGLALGIVILSVRKTMLAAVQFEVQSGFLAKEIKIVQANGMLTAEFIAVEAAVTQPTPDKFLRPSFFLPESAGACNVSHGESIANCIKWEIWFFARPHPDLLPLGEGTAIARCWFCGRASGKSRHGHQPRDRRRFSLSWEETVLSSSLQRIFHSVFSWLALILAFSPWEKEQPSYAAGFAGECPANPALPLLSTTKACDTTPPCGEIYETDHRFEPFGFNFVVLKPPL